MSTVDLADALAAGADLDAMIHDATPMGSLADQHEADVELARVTLADAMKLLGAGATTRDEREKVARLLTEHVDALAWLSVLQPTEWAKAAAALAVAGSFGSKAEAIRKLVSIAAKEPTQELRRSRISVAGPNDVLTLQLGEAAEGSNLPDGLIIPRPWMVTNEGVFLAREGKDGSEVTARVAQRPILLSAIGVDLEEGVHSVAVRWWSNGAWIERIVPRRTIAIARELAPMAEHGLPVTSENAKDLVAYFDAYLGANESRLPRRLTTRSLGWKGTHGFLWGGTLIGPNGPVANSTLTLAGTSPGLTQAVKNYRASGTWEGWCAAIARVNHLPKLMVAILGSMAPPMLNRVSKSLKNGIIDWAGETSGGKTTALRVAASVWGVPDDTDGIIGTWDGTSVGIERLAATCNDLPTLLDDTKRARRKEDVGDAIYMLAQGKGKARGTIDGLALTPTWRTWLLSTGEAPATSYNQDGGGAARVLTLWGHPMGDDPNAAALAESTARDLMDNFGHLGPRLVAFLQQPGHTETLKRAYAEASLAAASAQDSSVGRRVSAHIALLSVCYTIAVELGVPIGGNPISVLSVAVAQAVSDSDKASAALHVAYEWAVTQSHRFHGRHHVHKWSDSYGNEHTEGKHPFQGYIGAWKSKDDWTEMAFMTSALETHLAANGYKEPKAIVRTWRDRGWLRAQRTAHMGAAGSCPAIIVTRDAINLVVLNGETPGSE